MEGFVCKWDPENQNGQIHACPQDQFYALIGQDNPSVASVLNSIYPNGYTAAADCPGAQEAVKTTFDPGPDETAQNVVIVSQLAASPVQLAQTASMHALEATRHVSNLAKLPGVEPTVLGAAHMAATSAHSAAASAIMTAMKSQKSLRSASLAVDRSQTKAKTKSRR